ncbi:MAG: hypothetical protein ACREDY_06245 [Bradyrhizobium sp.]
MRSRPTLLAITIMVSLPYFAHAQDGSPIPPGDSASISVMMEGTYHLLAPLLADRAFDRVVRPWKVDLPPRDSGYWVPFAARLRLELGARPVAPTDNYRSILMIKPAVVRRGNVVGKVVLGGRWHCPDGEAKGTESVFEIRIENGRAVEVSVLEGDSADCRPGEARDPAEGRYLINIFAPDSTGTIRQTDRMLLVLTVAPMPDAVTRQIDGQWLRRGDVAPDHGACHRSAPADRKASRPSLPIHTQWKRQGDSIVVDLWHSVDAGRMLYFVVDSTGVHGYIHWDGPMWGQQGRDSITGMRTGPADPTECLR